MRHRKNYRHLSRTSSHRQAMFSNMVCSLFAEERIQTTDAKAKELRGIAERLITVAKNGAQLESEAQAAVQAEDKQRLAAAALHKRRMAARTVKDKDVLRKLFGDIQARFQDRQGGYTRILKVGYRKGDAAPMSLIELTVRKTVASVAPKADAGDEEA